MNTKFEMDSDLLVSAEEIMWDAQAHCEADVCVPARLDISETQELAQARLKSAKTAETLLYCFGTR